MLGFHKLDWVVRLVLSGRQKGENTFKHVLAGEGRIRGGDVVTQVHARHMRGACEMARGLGSLIEGKVDPVAAVRKGYAVCHPVIMLRG